MIFIWWSATQKMKNVITDIIKTSGFIYRFTFKVWPTCDKEGCYKNTKKKYISHRKRTLTIAFERSKKKK